MSFSSLIKSLWDARFGNATIVCSVCFMKEKQHSKREKRDRWAKRDKTWKEAGWKRLPGLAVKTAPDIVVTDLELPQQTQSALAIVMYVHLASQQVQIRPQQKKTTIPGQVLLTGSGKENFAIEVFKKSVQARGEAKCWTFIFLKTEVAKFSASLWSVMVFLYAEMITNLSVYTTALITMHIPCNGASKLRAKF